MSDTEAPIRASIRAAMEQDFIVYEEHPGVHLRGGEKVRFDLVLVPRKHLLENGFDDGCVVVEVKHFSGDDVRKQDARLRDLLWQCVVYSYSEVSLPDRGSEQPLFVLHYIGGAGVHQRHKGLYLELQHLVQRGGIGALEIHPKYGWSMNASGNHYFRQSTGRGPQNVLIRHQAGSAR